MTGGTVLATNRGVDLIGRCRDPGSTTHMAGLAQCRSRGIVIHRHAWPARVTVTGFATAQSGMVRRAELIGRMTSGDPATRNNTAVVNRS